ncbi:MAG: hypothetical protein V3R64_02070 [Sphingomonadales bacterium]
MKKLLFVVSFLFFGCQENQISESGELADLVFEVTETVPIGTNPHGMQKVGDTLFIAAAGDDFIELLDLNTMTITARWAAPDVPLDLVKARGGWLVSAFRGDYLHLLDEEGNPTGETWRVGSGPSLYNPDQGGDLAYIVSELADKFSVFDRSKNELIATYPTGKRPYPADVTHDGVLAFIPNRDEDTVSVIDLLNGEEVTKVAVCDEPLGGSLTRDEVSYIVTCGGDDKVQFINTASFKVVGEVAEGIGPRPFSVAVSPDETYAFVNNSRGTTISVINLDKMAVSQNIEVGEIPIVMRIFDHTLYVASEGSNTLSVIPLALTLKTMGGVPNEVVVLGMIHDGHETSESYSLEVVRDTIRKINPDIIIAEIPPNRLDEAFKGFHENGVVRERRVSVFPEYVSVVFPLTNEMDFEVRGGAAWNTFMNRYRSRALDAIEKDPTRAAEWKANRTARRNMSEAIGNRGDDPLFIHSDEYDAIQKAGWEPYDKHFNDELGPGGWENINAGHYRLIAKVLQDEMFKGKRILITFGASHKYWFMQELRARDDITLLDAQDFFK